MMLLRSLCLSWTALGICVPLSAQAGAECRPARTALVLSGGGATGLAHVGVIRVMDSVGIRPDLIVGSSMGAVVGAMYASGHSGRELDSIVRALPLDELFGASTRLPSPLSEWPFQLAFRHGDGKLLPELPFVNERELNLMLSAWLLDGNLRAAGDFDSLPIPFRAVATDLEHRRPLVLSSGDLALAVRASIAIPVLFRPIRRDGHWLGDGSLTANIPVAIARDLGSERVIVSDATNHLADTLDLERLGNMGTLMLSMLLTQAGDSLGPDDILVRSDVSGFPKFDFSSTAKAALITKGIAAGREAFAHVTCRNGAGQRVSERRVASHIRIDSGGAVGARQLLRFVGAGDGEPLDAAALRTGLIKMGSGDAGPDAVWLNPRGTNDSVWLSVAARPSEPLVSALGVAWDADLGIRGWIGVVRRRPFADGRAVSLRVAVGRWRQEAEASARLAPTAVAGLVPLLSVVGAHEDVRDFAATGIELPPLRTHEFSGFVGAERDLGAGWETRLGATFSIWHEAVTGSASAPGISVQVLRKPNVRGVTGRADVAWNPEYVRVALSAAWPIALGRLRLTPALRYGWGRHLPPQHQFTLGGYEGFPGLRLGELRGNHEALARLHLSYRVFGPFRVTAGGAGGLAAGDGGAFPNGTWRLGARLGLGVDVPLAPVRIEYGRSTGGRAALFLRVGGWF